LILIDTTVAVDFLRGGKETVSRIKAVQARADPIGISSVTLFELLHPLRHRKLELQERAARSFVHQLSLLALDSAAAEESAEIMGSLLRIGEPVNAIDVLIAGTAVANGAEKLLSNDQDFQKIAKVSDLKVEIVEKKR
jgi:tRNA(fMet)-specific endonuclease VapC